MENEQFSQGFWTGSVKGQERVNIIIEFYLVMIIVGVKSRNIQAKNLIACGLYPVIVDLKAFAHTGKEIQAESADEGIHSCIRESVLEIKSLPFYVWNKEEEGIDGSAIYSKNGQKLPFQNPMVEE